MLYKRNLGKKYACHSCGAHFYDLNQPNPHCPRCGTDPSESPIQDPRLAAMARVKAEGIKGRRHEPDEEEVETDVLDDEDLADIGEEDDDTGEEDEGEEAEADFDDM